MAQDGKPDPAVVRQVLRYFVRHPQAADDLEGIARWRLVEEEIFMRVEETQRALAWLVDRRLLCRTDASGVSPVFTLNRERLDEAHALLDIAEKPREDQ